MTSFSRAPSVNWKVGSSITELDWGTSDITLTNRRSPVLTK